MPRKNQSPVRTTVYFNGKRHTLRAKNDRELAKKKRELLNKLESGLMLIDKGTTVEVWAQKWLDIYCKNAMGEGCYQNYAGIVKNQITPRIGALKLKDVRPIHCQSVLNAEIGRSTSFLSKIRQVMFRMFKYAKREGLISTNPADDLDLPTSEDGTRRSITQAERKAILSLADRHRSGLYVKMMLYCGLRPAECIPLQWADIDLDHGFITVSKALKKGSEQVGAPKSKAGTRKIPIPDIFLKDLKAAYTGNPFDLVFTQPTTGKMHTRSSLRCYWNNFERALDIEMGAKVYRNQIIVHAVADDLCPYCLRHTYGTDLQDAGVPINVAKYLMGHSDITTTANIYTDTTDDSIESAKEKINEKLCMSKCMSHAKEA